MKVELGKLTKSKFMYLWVSQILSQLTINIMNFLLLIRLFQVTGSTLATSFLWVSYALPAMIIGPFAAVSVDILDRRKMLILTNLLQGLVIFLFGFLVEQRVYLLYVVTLGYSFLNQFYVPAESASLQYLVPKKQLSFANGLFFITQQAALVLGFAVAGLLNHELGFRNSIFLCAAFLGAATISVSFLPQMKVKLKIPDKFEKAFVSFFEHIYEGYKYIRKNENIMYPFLLLMSLQIAMAVVVINVPEMAIRLLKINPNLAGLLVVLPAGVGSLAAAFLVPKLTSRGVRKRKIILTSLSALFVTLVAFSFAIPNLSFYPRLVLAFILILMAGVSFVGVMIPAQTYLQEITPPSMMGRLFGNFWFLTTVATVIPVIFSGVITEVLGIRMLFIVFSVLVLIAIRYGTKYKNSAKEVVK